MPRKIYKQILTNLFMAKEGGYVIKNEYGGGKSSMEPPMGYIQSAGQIGLTTDPRTANILKEVSSKLSTGVKQIELALVSPEVFDSIPKQQLEEVRRLSELTGVDVTVHAPVVDPSGFNRESGFKESQREATERLMMHAVERSMEVNPKGNSPVTFHSSGSLPDEIKKPDEKEPAEVYVVNAENGSIAGLLPIKGGFFPGDEEMTAQKELAKHNERAWRQKKAQISDYAGMAEESLAHVGMIKAIAEAKKKNEEDLSPKEKRALYAFSRGKNFLDNSYMLVKDLFENAAERATPETLKVLNEFKSRIAPKIERINSKQDSDESIKLMREVIDDGIETMTKFPAPEVFIPMKKYAFDKTTDTFANVALKAYMKYKEKAPIISIENPPAGGAFSTGEDLKNVVEVSRQKFVDKAVEEGMSESEAKKQAERLLGVTWDVGHINMIRKYGYDDNDVIAHSEKVAPFVKHIHLSDNFGFEHTELPMGMGNVPTGEIMKKLGEKGFEARKVIEAAQWWQHFQTPPVQETLEAFGSPLYSMHMGPYWSQAGEFQQGYYSGVGAIYPSKHYETFGAGFSQLPMELGGQFGGGGQGGRMGGGGME